MLWGNTFQYCIPTSAGMAAETANICITLCPPAPTKAFWDGERPGSVPGSILVLEYELAWFRAWFGLVPKVGKSRQKVLFFSFRIQISFHKSILQRGEDFDPKLNI